MLGVVEEYIATPGAKMSTQEPKLEKDAMELSAAIAPTVTALGAEAACMKACAGGDQERGSQ